MPYTNTYYDDYSMYADAVAPIWEEGGGRMPDSLVLHDIELLGGGVPSTHPGCEGAIFRLGRDYSLGAPSWETVRYARTLMAGEQAVSQRAGNRTMTIPVVIAVPSTGPDNHAADETTLATAREYLLEQATKPSWQLIWTRDGGLPVIYDCQGVTTSTVEYSIIYNKNLFSLVEIECEALPFGHSDVAEPFTLPAPAQFLETPPTPVNLDTMSSVSSAVDAALWTSSTETPVSGGHSARWSRVWRQAPVYDHTISSTSITGRTKLGFYAGLATSQSQLSTWQSGRVTFVVTLYDSTGLSVSFRTTKWCKASGLQSAPHWQYITLTIPQVSSGFNYAAVTRYVVTAWNLWDAGRGRPGLQAGLYLGQITATAPSLGNTLTRGILATLPGVVGSGPAELGLQIVPGALSTISTIWESSTPGSNNWTSASGQTVIDKAEAWGGGGGGGSACTAQNGGEGGGSGEYAMQRSIPVAGSTLYHPLVGAAGTGGAAGNHAGTNGGDTSFTGASGPTLTAHGGKGGSYQVPATAKGGQGSINDQHNPGGDGGHASFDNNWNRGSGGAPSAGPAAAGPDAYDRTPPDPVSGGGPGGMGGYTTASDPHTGTAPPSGPGGGGGGGAYFSGTAYAGGDGRPGKIRLTYGATGLLALSSVLVHMPPEDEPLTYSPICAVGNGADTPNGSTEYTIPAVGGLPARFDGVYNLWLIGSGTWGSSGTARQVTVTVKQYPYSGGTAVTQAIARTFTPSTDIINGYVDMGMISLPIQAIPPGNRSAYFTVTVNSAQTADRYLDVLLTSSEGTTLLINSGTASWWNLWADPPPLDADLGPVLGSDADRDRAYSISQYIDRWPGGPFRVYPDSHNRLVLYSAQGCPGATGSYLPAFYVDRT